MNSTHFNSTNHRGNEKNQLFSFQFQFVNKPENEFKVEFTSTTQQTPVCQTLQPSYSTNINAYGIGVVYIYPPMQNLNISTSTVTNIPGITTSTSFSAIQVTGFLQLQNLKITKICTLGVSVKLHQYLSGAAPIIKPQAQVLVTTTEKEISISVTNGTLNLVQDVQEDIRYISQILYVGSGNCYSFYATPSYSSSTVKSLIISEYSQELGTQVGPITKIDLTSGLASKILRSITGFIKIIEINGSGKVILKAFKC